MKAEYYEDIDGNPIPLGGLDADERRLVARLRRRARTHPDWTAFDNYWMPEVRAFYKARGQRRAAVMQRAPFRIAQDLSARLGIASGMVRPSDLRDDLEDLIRTKYATQRAFCKATGLGEDMLSHFLAGRKDLSLHALTEALERVGYRLRIRAKLDVAEVPVARKRTG